MNVIDAHHHLWNLGSLSYPWLEDPTGTSFFGSYDAIRRNYLLTDYLDDCENQPVVKSVHVQAEVDESDPVAETRWLQSVADDPRCHGFPHGIVAFADFTQPDVDSVLAAHCDYAHVRGIRQILNYHRDSSLTYTPRNLLDDPLWRRNFKCLKKYGLSFDLQLYYQQMSQGAELARENPEILIILNHTGMPVERTAQGLNGWREGMRALSECENVVVKISGLGMCDTNWSEETIRPFVHETLELFGVERCMFASNFPVDRLFSDYGTLLETFRKLTSGFSDTERQGFFHDNAANYYRLWQED